MAIACAYCGGKHPLVADVRACWERSRQESDLSSPLTSAGTVATEATTAPPPGHTGPASSGPAASGPGPDALGRNVIVAPGQTPPEPWSGAVSVTIDQQVLADPQSLVGDVRRHAHERRRIVFHLHAPFDHHPRSVDRTPPYALGPRFSFPLDDLHHLVWANSIDLRSDPPRWALLDAAVSLGAIADGPADVILPSGDPAWLDGGPLQFSEPIDGIPVVHAIAVDHGSLRPFGHNANDAVLAPDQLAAVTHPGGAARIIAPAGSGKTRVLTERARHLRRAWQLPAGAVSLVAFNRRAQREMAERTSDLAGLHVRTLNAIALAIVNGTRPFASTPSQLRTIDEGEVRRVLGRLVEYPARRNQDPLAPWLEALTMVRLGLRSPEEVEARYDGDVSGLAEVWPRYVAALEAGGVIDFDHQVYRALELLLHDAEVRAAAQRACRVLLVDEFQDLTPAHLLLVRLLAAPGGEVFGVGDDDQTIYGYNGADPAWLIDFGALFPGAGDHPLEVNYRCPGGVVTAADRLLRRNRHRVAKVIRSDSAGADGLTVDPSEDPVAATVNVVQQAIAEGRPPHEVAVLTRVNALLAPVQVALTHEQVPVVAAAGPEFLSHVSVRAVLAWLRLAQADDHLAPDDLGEALRRPNRPLHPRVSDWVREQTSVAGLRRLAKRLTNERDAERVESFATDLDRLGRRARSAASTADLLRILVDDMGLGGAVATLDHTRRGMNRAAQSDDLTALSQLAGLHPEPATFERWLVEALSRPSADRGVVLSTVHRVKGQEWPLVVVHQADVDQFPHRLAEDVEEERRIFHVAVTRAAEQVVVVTGARPSPFVAELQTDPADDDRPIQLATDRMPPATSARSSNRSSGSGAEAAERGPLADRSSVLAADGLVLVDGGQEWAVVQVHADAVETMNGSARRRFALGSKVVTLGRQRGALVFDPSVSPASIRAFDLLRQRRDVLRDGKPAYVVFDDATLERIALALPGNTEELAAVRGVGPAKLEQYADEVLLAVEDVATWTSPSS